MSVIAMIGLSCYCWSILLGSWWVTQPLLVEEWELLAFLRRRRCWPAPGPPSPGGGP